MNELDKKRKEIVKVDKKIKKLFLKRMNIVKEIGEIKKENNLPILDLNREEYLKLEYTKDMNEFKDEYLLLLNTILEVSKKIQK